MSNERENSSFSLRLSSLTCSSFSFATRMWEGGTSGPRSKIVSLVGKGYLKAIDFFICFSGKFLTIRLRSLMQITSFFITSCWDFSSFSILTILVSTDFIISETIFWPLSAIIL